jgi:hypothetical protein
VGDGFPNRTGSGFPNVRPRQRNRSPRSLGPGEGPAVATIRHVINAEEMFHHRNNRYATVEELVRSGSLRLDVGNQAKAFVRRNYRFEVTVEEDGFKVVAIPVSAGPRPFHGDDSGVIESGLE